MDRGGAWPDGADGTVRHPDLRSVLQSPERGLRIWASIALAEIASDPDAVPALIEALEDADLAENWEIACRALASVGPPAAPAKDHLLALTTCPVDTIQEAARAALSAIDRKLS